MHAALRLLKLPIALTVVLLLPAASLCQSLSPQTSQKTATNPAAHAKASRSAKVPNTATQQATAGAGHNIKTQAAVSQKTAPVTVPKAPSEHIVTITGDFSSLIQNPPTVTSLKASLVTDDGTRVDDQSKGKEITAHLDNSSQIVVSYTPADSSLIPAVIYLGINSPDTPFPFTITNPVKLPVRRLTVSGDFCQLILANNSIPEDKCGTGLPIGPNPTADSGIEGYVYSADGTGYTPITVYSLSSNLVDIQYSADPSFHPSWITLSTPAVGKQQVKISATFAYVAASPLIAQNAVYEAEESICQQPKGGDCADDLILKSLGPELSQEIRALSVDQKLIFASVVARVGQLPETVTVCSPANLCKTLDGKSPYIRIARLTHQPADDQSLLAVSMTQIDQKTVHRTFGAYIAQHYLAVDLTVSNRTEKTLQFDKSAIWFDVDFSGARATSQQEVRNFFSTATADIVPVNPYANAFTTTDCRDDKHKDAANNTPCENYLFGIRQAARVSPLKYSALLDVYDTNTERLDRILRVVQLAGSVADTIATGGIVAQVHNTAFRDSMQIFSGSFLPSFSGILQDTTGTDRLRKNLVNETIQDIVQVGPHNRISTVAILPRDGILAFNGSSKLVVINKIRNVHIDPDVVNGTKDAPVPANHLEVGYTKDQVRQSLGEPQTVSTGTDGSSSFAFAVGPYAKVNFSDQGKVISWDSRSIADQLNAAPTLDAAQSILTSNALSSTKLTLFKGNSVLTDIKGVSAALQYDSSGKHIGDYTLLYQAILKQQNNSVDMATFEKVLGSKKDPPTDTYTPNDLPTKKDVTLIYAMPDVVGGTMSVTFNGPPLASNPNTTPTITKITFLGLKSTAF